MQSEQSRPKLLKDATDPLAIARIERDTEAGRRVLKTEADALLLTATLLDQRFSAAIDLLLATKGRLIVSGIGKSGHVGRKIASTFASTGTPAHFVHPAEASHGDLGMITNSDSLLLLSNSGEAKELSDMLAHSRRFQIPTIAMTGRAQSTLAQHADLVLVLPPAPEACPMGLAPTTSSTMTLALGDALAVALMERRGFTRDSYRELHPGGALGSALKRVRDIMHAGGELPLAPMSAPMRDVILVMTSHGFGCAGILDEAGALEGIITDGDLRRHFLTGSLDEPAAAWMTHRPRTIPESALVAEALQVMNGGAGRPITCLFVTSDAASRQPTGIIHIHDCLRAGLR